MDSPREAPGAGGLDAAISNAAEGFVLDEPAPEGAKVLHGSSGTQAGQDLSSEAEESR